MNPELLMSVPETIEDRYQEEERLYGPIYENGFSKYTQTLPDLPVAFELRDQCISCIDEGTPEGIHVAGGGILLNKKELEAYLKLTNADEIRSHEGCGAATLYAKTNGLDVSRADFYAQEWAQSQAEKYDLRYRHISATEMKRPNEGHFARTCYYDLTGRFHWDGAKDMPGGFTISRKFLNKEYALKEVALALGIAFGHHGLGERLSEEKPFLITAIAESNEQLAAAQKELGTLEHSYGLKIKIDGFVHPSVILPH